MSSACSDGGTNDSDADVRAVVETTTTKVVAQLTSEAAQLGSASLSADLESSVSTYGKAVVSASRQFAKAGAELGQSKANVVDFVGLNFTLYQLTKAASPTADEEAG